MGKLVLLNTPIGNLGDVTQRMLEAYKNGKYFFAEDTRNFKQLLNHLGVSLEGKRINSFHDHSGESSVDGVLQLTDSHDVYFVSDAGSPVISDPAYPLIREAYSRGIGVDSISGVSSVVNALELGGLPSTPFTFLGFLPRDNSKQEKLLERCRCTGGTFVLFESPHRVEKTIQKILSFYEVVEVSAVREISKQFQEVKHFCSVEEFNEVGIKGKGEFVLLFYLEKGEEKIKDHPDILEFLDGRQSKKELAKLLSKLGGGKTKKIYLKLN